MVTPTITHATDITIVSARDHFLFFFVKHLGKFSSNMPLQSLLLPTNDTTLAFLKIPLVETSS